MSLSKEQLAQMIDISAVKADSTILEVESIITTAKEHGLKAVFPMPSFTKYAKKLLEGESDILLGGTVGFPSGATTTTSKAFEAEELVSFGCDELDMVINIGKLKSKMYKDVTEDIREVVTIANNIPVKVILEVSLLTEEEIINGSKIVCDTGAKFIKTGTGWNGPTTMEQIRMIKNTVGNSIYIKVAGGVRNLDTLLKIHELGVSRFGLGRQAAVDVMNEFLRKSAE